MTLRLYGVDEREVKAILALGLGLNGTLETDEETLEFDGDAPLCEIPEDSDFTFLK